mmetsp:Transcript_17446/g.35227  ORF Transcript_17446/g.35227 Transcript_17446/m.35227 type:complete len:323 (+) Transcript_17446:219-1187(+)
MCTRSPSKGPVEAAVLGGCAACGVHIAVLLPRPAVWREGRGVQLCHLGSHLLGNGWERRREVAVLPRVLIESEEAAYHAAVTDRVEREEQRRRRHVGVPWTLPAIHRVGTEQELPQPIGPTVLDERLDDGAHVAPAPLVDAAGVPHRLARSRAHLHLHAGRRGLSTGEVRPQVDGIYWRQPSCGRGMVNWISARECRKRRVHIPHRSEATQLAPLHRRRYHSTRGPCVHSDATLPIRCLASPQRVVVGATSASKVNWPSIVRRKDDEGAYVHVARTEQIRHVAHSGIKPVDHRQVPATALLIHVCELIDVVLWHLEGGVHGM